MLLWTLCHTQEISVITCLSPNLKYDILIISSAKNGFCSSKFEFYAGVIYDCALQKTMEAVN